MSTFDTLEDEEFERDWKTMAGVVALVVCSNVMSNRVLPSWLYVLWNAGVAVVLVVIALRVDRLSLSDVGLGRSQLRLGLRWGGTLAACVAVVYAVGLAVPTTRELFRDKRADGTGWDTLYMAFVSVPFGTVLLEEVAFRGVLPAVFTHRMSRRAAIACSSLLFGLWHLLPAANINRTNAVLNESLSGASGQVIAIAGAVLSTAAVGVFFCWLRYRSNSLLTPILLHISTNSLAYVGAHFVLRP